MGVALAVLPAVAVTGCKKGDDSKQEAAEAQVDKKARLDALLKENGLDPSTLPDATGSPDASGPDQVAPTADPRRASAEAESNSGSDVAKPNESGVAQQVPQASPNQAKNAPAPQDAPKQVPVAI